MSIYSYSNLGPQQPAVATWTADYPLNQWPVAPSAPVAVPETQQVVAAPPETVEVQGPSEKQTSKPPTYAETTCLRVDEQARETLRSYGERKIAGWTGKSLRIIISGRQNYITVRDARIINSYAVA